jgi:hypothetical protein
MLPDGGYQPVDKILCRSACPNTLGMELTITY